MFARPAFPRLPPRGGCHDPPAPPSPRVNAGPHCPPFRITHAPRHRASAVTGRTARAIPGQSRPRGGRSVQPRRCHIPASPRGATPSITFWRHSQAQGLASLPGITASARSGRARPARHDCRGMTGTRRAWPGAPCVPPRCGHGLQAAPSPVPARRRGHQRIFHENKYFRERCRVGASPHNRAAPCTQPRAVAGAAPPASIARGGWVGIGGMGGRGTLDLA